MFITISLIEQRPKDSKWMNEYFNLEYFIIDFKCSNPIKKIIEINQNTDECLIYICSMKYFHSFYCIQVHIFDFLFVLNWISCLSWWETFIFQIVFPNTCDLMVLLIINENLFEIHMGNISSQYIIHDKIDRIRRI